MRTSLARARAHWACVALTCLAPGHGAAGDITLVAEGHSHAVVVVPQSLSGELSRLNNESQLPRLRNSTAIAAAEVARGIGKVTGVRPEVVVEGDRRAEGSPTHIYVGECAASRNVLGDRRLSAETYVIETRGSDLFIAGGDRTEAGLEVAGTAAAAYVFLEECLGIRWLFPGELGEVVPRVETLSLPVVHRRGRPVIWQRKIRNSETHGHRDRIQALLKEWGVDYGAWRENFSDDVTGAWFRRQRLGARVRISYGHSYNDWWHKYGQEHPDFFALQPNGSRRQVPRRERLCVSNPKLWDFVAGLRIQQLKADPTLLAASISPNDGGPNKFCMCGRCRSWDPPEAPKVFSSALVDPRTGSPFPEYPALTDRYFRYYNEVAKRVGKALPDRLLGVYAYSVYRTPPVKIRRLEPNIIVGYVGLKREDIDAWAHLANQLFIRPNDLWDSAFFGLPRDFSRYLAESVRYCVAHRARAFDFDGGIGNWGSHGLAYYVLAKMLWNPERDLESVVDDYCRAAYGPAAGAMKAYYDRLRRLDERIRAESKYSDRRKDAHVHVPAYYAPQLLDALQADLAKARAAVKDDSAFSRRVALVAESVDYARQFTKLLRIANGVRTKQDWQDYQVAKTRFLEWLKAHVMSWAITVPHDYYYGRYAIASAERAARQRLASQVSRQ